MTEGKGRTGAKIGFERVTHLMQISAIQDNKSPNDDVITLSWCNNETSGGKTRDVRSLCDNDNATNVCSQDLCEQSAIRYMRTRLRFNATVEVLHGNTPALLASRSNNNNYKSHQCIIHS